MLFNIHRTSDIFRDEESEREFNDLRDLEAFQLASNSPIIINFQKMTIEIYDDYRE